VGRAAGSQISPILLDAKLNSLSDFTLILSSVVFACQKDRLSRWPPAYAKTKTPQAVYAA